MSPQPRFATDARLGYKNKTQKTKALLVGLEPTAFGYQSRSPTVHLLEKVFLGRVWGKKHTALPLRHRSIGLKLALNRGNLKENFRKKILYTKVKHARQSVPELSAVAGSEQSFKRGGVTHKKTNQKSWDMHVRTYDVWSVRHGAGQSHTIRL